MGACTYCMEEHGWTVSSCMLSPYYGVCLVLTTAPLPFRLRTLRGLRAVDKLSGDQMRQLSYDLEAAYHAFETHLRAAKRAV